MSTPSDFLRLLRDTIVGLSHPRLKLLSHAFIEPLPTDNDLMPLANVTIVVDDQSHLDSFLDFLGDERQPGPANAIGQLLIIGHPGQPSESPIVLERQKFLRALKQLCVIQHIALQCILIEPASSSPRKGIATEPVLGRPMSLAVIELIPVVGLLPDLMTLIEETMPELYTLDVTGHDAQLEQLGNLDVFKFLPVRRLRFKATGYWFNFFYFNRPNRFESLSICDISTEPGGSHRYIPAFLKECATSIQRLELIFRDSGRNNQAIAWAEIGRTLSVHCPTLEHLKLDPGCNPRLLPPSPTDPGPFRQFFIDNAQMHPTLKTLSLPIRIYNPSPTWPADTDYILQLLDFPRLSMDQRFREAYPNLKTIILILLDRAGRNKLDHDAILHLVKTIVQNSLVNILAGGHKTLRVEARWERPSVAQLPE